MTNKDYKRLTPKNAVVTGRFSGKTLLDRLTTLENVIENGTLVFLPCRVRDTVYFVNYGLGRKPIEPYIVDRITITSNKVIFDTHQVEPPQNLGLIYSDSWGKNVFFTKDAAEARLKEIRGKK